MHRPSATRFVLASALLVVAGFTAGAAPSNAGPTNKTFTSSLSGVNFTDFTTASAVVVAITNTARGPQPFGSANITIPTGFTPCTSCAASSSDYDGRGFKELALVDNGDGTWTLPVRSDTGSGVAPGSTIHVTTWVTDTSVSCQNTSWPVGVKQSNDFSGTGNDFIGPAATPAGYLTFTTQPPSATEFDKDMDPAPQVTSFNGCGGSTPPGTVTLSDTAGKLTQYSATTMNTGTDTPNYVTTFTGVQFKPYFDFTDQLVASAAGFTSAKSEPPFTVAQKVQPCDSDPTIGCPPLTLDSVRKTSAVVSVPNPNSGGFTSGSETGADNSMCGEADKNIPDSEISATVSVLADAAKTVTFTIDKKLVLAIANNGAPFMSVCLRTTDANGKNTDITLLDCFKGGVTTDPPCVVSRNKNQGNEVIVVSLPPGDPHSNVY